MELGIWLCSLGFGLVVSAIISLITTHLIRNYNEAVESLDYKIPTQAWGNMIVADADPKPRQSRLHPAFEELENCPRCGALETHRVFASGCPVCGW